MVSKLFYKLFYAFLTLLGVVSLVFFTPSKNNLLIAVDESAGTLISDGSYEKLEGASLEALRTLL